MKPDELNKHIDQIFGDWLLNYGFKGEAVLYGYSYIKKMSWGTQMFGFSYVNYGDKHLVMVSQGYISFDIVESILREKLRLFNESFNKSNITFCNFTNPTVDTRNIYINNESDFIGLVPVWKKDIEDKVLPFFDQWSDLKKINDEIIEKIPEPELPNYITGETGLKRMIIMKLCNNPNYQQYISEWEFGLVLAKDKNQKYQAFYDLFIELKTELESIQPIY